MIPSLTAMAQEDKYSLNQEVRMEFNSYLSCVITLLRASLTQPARKRETVTSSLTVGTKPTGRVNSFLSAPGRGQGQTTGKTMPRKLKNLIPGVESS